MNKPMRDERPRAADIRSYVKRFAGDESGVMTIFGIYIFVAMIVVVGIGVDIMRYERDRAHLQATLDRAVLAAADLDQPLDPEAVVHDYFAKAGMSDALGAVSVVETLGSRQVTASAEETFFTQFMHMSGVDTMQTRAVSGALESIPNVEISLVLDISGSMRFSNRMTEMRAASKKFANSVLRGSTTGTGSGTGTGNGTVTTINLIPYAGQTNPGPEMFAYLGGRRFGTSEDEYFDEWGQDISNVAVWFDLNGNGVVDTKDEGEGKDFSAKIEGYPSSDVDAFNKDNLNEYFEYVVAFVKRKAAAAGNPLPAGATALGASIKGGQETTTFFYTSDGDPIPAPREFWQKTDMTLQFNDFYQEVLPNNASSCLEMPASDFTHDNLPNGSNEQVGHFMKWDIAAAVMDWGWCPADRSAIQYAQTDPDQLASFIDNIRMHDGTGTQFAMKYAVALLNPATQSAFDYLRSRGLVPNDITARPAPWNAPDTTKYIVLMTDGQITEQFRPVDKLNPIHGVEEFSGQPSANSYMLTSRSTNLSNFYAQCNLAKANGVVIYTIAFDAPAGATTEMRNCASSANHFFRVSNGELDKAFTAIASQINHLRLTQ